MTVATFPSRVRTKPKFSLERLIKDIVSIAFVVFIVANIALRVTMPFQKTRMMEQAGEYCATNITPNYLLGSFEIYVAGGGTQQIEDRQNGWWQFLSQANPGTFFAEEPVSGEANC